jgi:hypothetical protein
METAFTYATVIPGLIISFGFIVGGAMAATMSLSQLKLAWSMQAWPKTSGEVRSSRIDINARGLYRPEIEYVFTVGARQIVGKRRTLFAGASSNRVWADTIVAQYPTGSSVTVYYDPNDPRQCIVDRTNCRTLAVIFAFVCFGFSAIGLACLDHFTRQA